MIKSGGKPVKRWRKWRTTYSPSSPLIRDYYCTYCSVGPPFPAPQSLLDPSSRDPGGLPGLLHSLRRLRLLQVGRFGTNLLYNNAIRSLQASGDMNPQKAIITGKLKVRGNFLLLQKLQSIFWVSSVLFLSVCIYILHPTTSPPGFESLIRLDNEWKFIIFLFQIQKY